MRAHGFSGPCHPRLLVNDTVFAFTRADSRYAVPVLTPVPGGVQLRVRVQPRAAKTGIVGEHGGALRIRVAAPPVDGAANEALVRFLADRLGVSRSAVSITGGASGRSKLVRIGGIDPGTAAARLGILNFPPPVR